MKTKHHGQMSESFLTAVFLSLSGGLQDAYTYLFRGKVFANAQTGNIVLLSTNIMDGRWDKVLHYLVPLCAFALGVLAAEKCGSTFRRCSGCTGGSWWCWARCCCCSRWAFCRNRRTCWPTPLFPSPAPCRYRLSAR